MTGSEAAGPLAAHHIARKALLPFAQFDTGNGITLCRVCHRIPHKGFNGRPDVSLPMDAQGGEKIEVLWELYQRLLGDAVRRGTMREEHYELSAPLLTTFRKLQGLDDHLPIPGGSLEQACLIWRQTPRGMIEALLKANGIELPPGFVQTGPITLFFDD